MYGDTLIISTPNLGASLKSSAVNPSLPAAGLAAVGVVRIARLLVVVLDWIVVVVVVVLARMMVAVVVVARLVVMSAQVPEIYGNFTNFTLF